MSREHSKLIDKEYLGFISRVYSEMIPLNAVGPENGGQGELQKCTYLESLLREIGLPELRRSDAQDPRAKGGVRPNLLGRLTPSKKRTLWIVGHMDVVPAGDRSLWSREPFSATTVSDRIYGRGTEDDGQGIVLGLVCAKALLDHGVEAGLGLAFVSDEETGSVFGAQKLVERHVFSPGDWILVPDAGNPRGSMLEVAEKGSVWMQFKVIGKQTHASTPAKGVNAARLGSRLLLELDERLHSEFASSDPLFDPPVSTFEPTRRLENVGNINTVPGTDVFFFDCRVLPSHRIQDIMDTVRAIVDDFTRSTGAGCEFSVLKAEEPSTQPAGKSEFAQVFAESLQRTRGVDALPRGIGGGTVARFFRRAGYETVVWMTCDETAHQPDEYVKPLNILADAETVLDVLRRF